MRVFITGATGFVGSRVVKELIGTGHTVLGLARSDAAAESLRRAGAEALRGTLEQIEVLKNGAASCDSTLHLGMNHAAPNILDSFRTDKLAIEAIGSVLAGTNRTLIVTGGVAGLVGANQVATEENTIPSGQTIPRVSEQAGLSLVSHGVRAMVMRLPQVHDTVKQGLVTMAIAVARQKGFSAFVGEGSNRWSAAHVTDVAQLYRLALENPEAGARWHAVDEVGVRFRDIAEEIGRGLSLPVKSITPAEAPAHFGWWGALAGADLLASSEITRRKLGWKPTGPGMLADLQRMDFSAIAA